MRHAAGPVGATYKMAQKTLTKIKFPLKNNVDFEWMEENEPEMYEFMWESAETAANMLGSYHGDMYYDNFQYLVENGFVRVDIWEEPGQMLHLQLKPWGFLCGRYIDSESHDYDELMFSTQMILHILEGN